jgi:hypothetical protein
MSLAFRTRNVLSGVSALVLASSGAWRAARSLSLAGALEDVGGAVAWARKGRGIPVEKKVRRFFGGGSCDRVGAIA